MLRVRPVLFTSAPGEWTALLAALGLACTENRGGRRVLGCGDGKVGLIRAAKGSPEDGTAALGFELRDRAVFVRRTLEAGTRAELVESDHGPAARVTAPDGFSFLADPATDLAPRQPGPVAVVQVWHTPDPGGARKMLADIGARPLPPGPGGLARFQARNGGVVAVHAGGASGVELAVECDGGLAGLGARLAAAGVPVREGEGTLAVQAPGGTTLRAFAAGGVARSDQQSGEFMG